MSGNTYVNGVSRISFHTLSTVKKYSLESDRWTTVAPLPVGRYGHCACAVNGVVYVFGGRVDQQTLKYDVATIREVKWRP
jgi:hypothetical protein